MLHAEPDRPGVERTLPQARSVCASNVTTEVRRVILHGRKPQLFRGAQSTHLCQIVLAERNPFSKLTPWNAVLRQGAHGIPQAVVARRLVPVFLPFAVRWKRRLRKMEHCSHRLNLRPRSSVGIGSCSDAVRLHGNLARPSSEGLHRSLRKLRALTVHFVLCLPGSTPLTMLKLDRCIFQRWRRS